MSKDDTAAPAQLGVSEATEVETAAARHDDDDTVWNLRLNVAHRIRI